MRCFGRFCSIRIARIASRALRVSDTWLSSSMFLATCWVMVEAPTGRRPWPICVRSNTAARAIASGSTPGWVQKFWSSAETKACFTMSGTAEYGTKMRRSAASSAISRASPA